MERRNFLLFLPWIAAASTLRSRVVVPEPLLKTVTFPPVMVRMEGPVPPGFYQVAVTHVEEFLTGSGHVGIKVKQRILDGSNRDVFSYFSTRVPGNAIQILRSAGLLPANPPMLPIEVDMTLLQGKRMIAKVETHEYPEGVKRNIVVEHRHFPMYGKKWNPEA